jgi:two-component system cell cycle sensor histidine kinase/response regulator CckA
MVEQHGGEVQVETKLGIGTSFVLRLPAYHGEHEAGEQVPSEPTLHGRHILVVDDDPRVRRAMAEILSAAGAQVSQAATGDAASTRMLSERIDALCTDAIMPGMPARELIDRFRARHPGAPVIVCSAYVESELLRRGIETESIAFLAKPFSAHHLLAKLHTVLQSTSAVRDASATS